VQGIKLVLHEEFPVRVLHDAVTNRNGLDLANWVPVTFVGSFVLLVGSCVMYLVEILYASSTISFDPIQVIRRP